MQFGVPGAAEIERAIHALYKRGHSVQRVLDIPGLYIVDGREVTTMQLFSILREGR